MKARLTIINGTFPCYILIVSDEVNDKFFYHLFDMRTWSSVGQSAERRHNETLLTQPAVTGRLVDEISQVTYAAMSTECRLTFSKFFPEVTNHV